MWGSHLIKHRSSTQKTIAFSPGETELAGIAKGIAGGMGLVSVARDLGVEIKFRVCADSSAAVGICRRSGIGRARHLAAGQLWVQGRVRSGDFDFVKWPGERNPADITTKAVNQELIDHHMAYVGVLWEGGRASSAPELEGFSWPGWGFPATPTRQVGLLVGAPTRADGQ
eukprot:9069122-Alexandrium_andersonii.AAC.2